MLTCLMLVNLTGLVWANVDPNFGSDFGSNFGTLFGLPDPLNNFSSTSNSTGAESVQPNFDFADAKTQSSDFRSPSSKLDINWNPSPDFDSGYLNSNAQDPRNLNASPGLSYQNGNSETLNYPSANSGLNYPSVNYNTNFGVNPEPESDQHPDNCTINPCLNGFCLLNQSNPLGYACFCKGKMNCSICYGGTFDLFIILICLILLVHNKTSVTRLDGFTGFQCQIEYNECKQDYCKNGATCVQEDKRLVCYCRNGYKGW